MMAITRKVGVQTVHHPNLDRIESKNSEPAEEMRNILDNKNY